MLAAEEFAPLSSLPRNGAKQPATLRETQLKSSPLPR
jgi:hypothetical protein